MELMSLPVINSLWIYAPVRRKWQSILAMVLFPLSLPLWLVGAFKQRQLISEIKSVITVCDRITALLRKDEAMPPESEA